MNMIAPQEGVLSSTLTLVVRQIRFEAVGINSYEFVDAAGRPLPAFTAGSHIDVHLGNGMVRQYSLSNAPSERHHYVIAVLKEAAGRGGSRRLHETIRVQDQVEVSLPRNNFEPSPEARRSILIGGGIGITPLKSMAHRLAEAGQAFELHYCARTPDHVAFEAELAALNEDGRVRFHFDGIDPAKRLDLAALLARPEDGTHVYFCGPGGFMAACEAATGHWPKGTVHREHFKAPEQPRRPAGDAATVCIEIRSTGQRIDIAPDQSVAEALNAAGIEIPTSCVAGLCGTCRIGYLSGDIDHQDMILSEDERAASFTACVSRPKHGVAVVDL